MSLVIPSVAEARFLSYILNRALTLKLYSNDYTPVEGSAAANFTEVVGGGYASKSLVGVNWSYTPGDPSYATYASQDFTFTGATTPNTVYGYYVVDGDGLLCWAERFPEAVVPFNPANNTVVRVTPRFEAS